jgi:cell division protein FtsW
MKSSSILIPRYLFIAFVVALLFIGLLMVYSASAYEAMAVLNTHHTHYLIYQLGWIVGSVLFVVVPMLIFMPYDFLDRRITKFGIRITTILWLLVVVLLIVVLFQDNNVLGASRSLDLGFISFVPGELVKITMMLTCVYLIIEHQESGFSLYWLIKLLVATAVPVGLLYLQPDAGTCAFALLGVLATIWLGDLPKHYIGIGIAGLVAFVVLAMASHGWRLARLEAVFSPFKDTSTDGYQFVSSFYAFADGGILGSGLGLSQQKYGYLPEAETDFIFAIIGNEWGFLGIILTVALFAGVVFSGIMIGRRAADLKGRLIACTSATLIGIQAIYNMLCVMGLLPITGKALPFISYGGASMVTTMALVGFILWVSFNAGRSKSYSKNRERMVVKNGGRNAISHSPASALPAKSFASKFGASLQKGSGLKASRANISLMESGRLRGKRNDTPLERLRPRAEVVSLRSFRANRSGMFASQSNGWRKDDLR